MVAAAVLAAPRVAYALPTTQSPACTGVGERARRLCHPPDHRAAGARGAGGLAGVGGGACQGLSACLVGRRRPQRRSGAPPSPSARLTEAALQGVDGAAELRWPRPRWDDACSAVFQAGVPCPL